MNDTNDASQPSPAPAPAAGTGSVWGCSILMAIAVVAISALVYWIRPHDAPAHGAGGAGGGGAGGHGGAGAAASSDGTTAAAAPGAGHGGTGAATTGTAAPPAESSSSSGGGGGKGGRFKLTGPMPVVVAAARSEDVGVTLNALGTVTSLASVTVKTQISGQLTEVAFQEGQLVKQGDFLAQIDPRPYQLTLAQSEGQLQRDQALQKEAELDLGRYRTLVAQDSIAKQQLDAQESLVAQYAGTVATDQAMVGTARLNLAYCHIVAPVGGRVGLRQVDQGNFVQTGDANGIVVITQLQPISVIFTIPEDSIREVVKRLHSGANLPVTAFDRGQVNQLAVGKLATVDNQIDTATGTVKLRALLENADETLFPNQFVNVQLLVDVLHGMTVVPTAAVLHGTPGAYVYLVGADDTVSVRKVEPGQVAGERTAILSGLEVGDRVVTDGADKLKDGAKVLVTAADDHHGAGAPGDASAKTGERRHRRRDQQASGDQPADGAAHADGGGQHAPAAAPAGDGEGKAVPAKPAAPADGKTGKDR